MENTQKSISKLRSLQENYDVLTSNINSGFLEVSESVKEAIESVRGDIIGGEYTTIADLRRMLNTLNTEEMMSQKRSIASAISLMGGNCLFKDLLNPTLSELLHALQTIPQELLKITESENIENTQDVIDSWAQNLRFSYSLAQQFQEKINIDLGIKSILYQDKKYLGFYMIEFSLNALTTDTSSGEFYITLSKVHGDAFYIGFNSGNPRLIEWDISDPTQKLISIPTDCLSESGRLFIFSLYEKDDFEGNVMYTDKGKVLIIGGHPVRIATYTSAGTTNSGTGAKFIEGIILLNETNNTDIYLYNTFTNNIYLKHHTGITNITSVSETVTIDMPYYEIPGIDSNNNVSTTNPVIKNASVLSKLLLGNITNVYAPIVSSSPYLTEVEIPTLQEIKSDISIISLFRINIFDSNASLYKLSLPNLKYIKADAGDSTKVTYYTLITGCPKLTKLDLSNLEECENVNILSGTTQIKELNLDKLKSFKKTCANNIFLIDGNHPIKVLRLPSLISLILRQNAGNNVGFLVGNNSMIEEIYCDELIEAINTAGSTEALVIYNCSNLRKIDMPKIEKIGAGVSCFALNKLPKLLYLRLGTLKGIYQGGGANGYGLLGTSLGNLIHLEIGLDTNINLYFEAWNPGAALDETKNDLVEDDTYENNLLQFRANFINCIAKKLYNHKPDGVFDGTTRILKLATAVYNSLTQTEIDEVTNKGWILQLYNF